MGLHTIYGDHGPNTNGRRYTFCDGLASQLVKQIGPCARGKLGILAGSRVISHSRAEFSLLGAYSNSPGSIGQLGID